MPLTEYNPENPEGWVVESTLALAPGRTHVSYWFGPEHGLGTTYGALHLNRERYTTTLEAAVWPTKAEALAAVRTVYGRVRTQRHRAVRLADALAALDAT